MIGTKYILTTQIISKFDIYLSKTVGLEKLFRLGQYVSKFVYLYNGLPFAGQLMGHFMFLFKSIAILKYFSFLKQVIKAKQTFNWWSLIAWMNLFKCYSLLLWKLFDLPMVLQLYNIILLAPVLAKKCQKVANYCWLSSLLWTVAIELCYFFTCERNILSNRRIVQNVKHKKDSILQRAKLKQLRAYYNKRKIILRKIILTTLDVIVVLKLLNLINRYDLLITFFGVVTSVEGVKDVWDSC